MEYATREQAQQAVNTLSNQNLMGRLVYVREVCSHSQLIPSQLGLTHLNRIVKPNLDSQDPQREVAADTMEHLVEASEADSEREWAPVVAVVAVKFMSPTFVSNPFISFLKICSAILLTFYP